MTDNTEDPAEANLFPKSVGERLRDARVAQKLELADIAQRTRVPLRHLQAIEDGDYSKLPTPTYAVGFAKAYARAIGADEVEVAREVRGAAEATAPVRRVPDYQTYDLDDAPRTPSGGVLIAAVVLALLFVIGVGIWYGTTWFRGDGLGGEPTAAAPVTPPEAAPAPAATPTVATTGQVTLVATDEVWVRVYDANSQTLLQKTMAPGERYDVPPTANGPMLLTGRPDKLQVLVNGTAVPPLGDGRVAIKDVGISAAALAARTAPQGAATPAAAPNTPRAVAPSAANRPRSGGASVPPFFRDPGAPPAAATPNPAATQPPGNGF